MMKYNNLNKNVKYQYFFSYKNKLVYFNDIELPLTHYIYTILNKYKIPNHIENVKIIDNKTIEEADNNLVFFGIDKNGKRQYFYGEKYIENRKKKKIEIFINVLSKIETIKKNIILVLNKGLSNKKINKEFLISAILELEMKTFIRLGKDISYEKNGTFGIRNLTKDNIVIYTTYITISFIGKKKMLYEYIIYKKDNILLYKILRLLKFQNNNSEYLFSNEKYQILSEYHINNFLNNNDITFKDLRLYGANFIFFKSFFDILKKNNKQIDEKELNNILKTAINTTASIIQHTSNISKNSYIIDIDTQKLLKNINLLYSIDNIDNFIHTVIKILTL